MSHNVSAADANQHFSAILREAESGETVVITRRGKPVAQLVPAGRAVADAGREAAWERLLRRADAGLDLGGERFDRDSLYERD